MKEYKIKYGDRLRRQWNQFKGLTDPIIQPTLHKLAQLDWGDYRPWIIGSILGDTETWDIDLVFEGPYNNKQKINELLQAVTDISFEEGVFVDVKYLIAGKVTNIQFLIEEGQQHKMHFAIPHSWIVINDKKTRCGHLVDGLNRVSRLIPFKKDHTKQHYDPIPLMHYL